MHKGQTVAIPVLDRHIKTSSGKCSVPEPEGYASNCVMADALRDRFPGALFVDVNSGFSSFQLDGQYVELANGAEMAKGVRDFDHFMNGRLSAEESNAAIRKAIPRVVHARVRTVETVESF